MTLCKYKLLHNVAVVATDLWVTILTNVTSLRAVEIGEIGTSYLTYANMALSQLSCSHHIIDIPT
jgi:hypothetical protein